MKISYLSLILMITCCAACVSTSSSIITPRIWSNLNIYSLDNGREGMNSVDNLLKNRANINKLLDFVEAKITNSGYISHRDQIKLACILLKTGNEKLNNEQIEKVKYLIDIGQKYRDFYYLVLTVEPQYILQSLEVFNEKGDIYAYVFHPDAGKVKRNIKKDFLDKLIRATKQNFGYNYDKWKEWWLSESQNMKAH